MNEVYHVKPPRMRKIVSILGFTSKMLFLALILFLLYFPILIIIIQSVNKNVQGTYFSGFTLEWYGKMFTDRFLMIAIKNTISIAFLATIVSTILGTLFALGIHSLNNKRRKQMIILNNVPVLNAEVVTGVSLFFIFKFIGIIIGNEFLLGYETMLIAHIFFCIPYVVLSVLPKINEVDKNLYDAALDLGCTPRGALLKVIVPSIKTGILSGALIAFTMSFDDFVISYLVAGAEIENFSIWLYNLKHNPGRTLAWPKAYAYNAIVSLLAMLTLVIYNIVSIKRQNKNRRVAVQSN